MFFQGDKPAGLHRRVGSASEPTVMRLRERRAEGRGLDEYYIFIFHGSEAVVEKE